MTDLFTLAKQMADNLSEDDKKKMQNMNMEDMMSTVSQNVMKMMKDFNPPTVDEIKKEPGRFVEDIEFSDSDEDVISPKSDDLLYTLNVKLEDLYNGKQKKISFKRKRFKKIQDEETGKVKYENFFEKKKVIVHIPPGTRDGHVIRFEKEADQHPGHDAGDVIITISEDEHDTFDRDGDNLFLIRDISLSEIYDLEYSFVHLDKRVITVKSEKGDCLHLKDGVRKVEGLGMPTGDGDKKGDLFIRFNLILPDKIDDIETLKTLVPAINKIDESSVETFSLKEVTDEDMERLEYSSGDSEDEDSEDEDSEDEDSNDDLEDEDSDDEEQPAVVDTEKTD